MPAVPYSATQQPADLTLIDNLKQWLGISGKYIASITNANPGVVTTQGAHGFLSGMVVPFDAVLGMTQLNGNYYSVTVISATQFSIGVDTSGFGVYVANSGYVGTDDALLGRLISSASQFIQSWLNRVIRSVPYVDTRNGYGQDLMPMNQYPLQSVSSVTIDGLSIPARSVLTPQSNPSGYSFDNDTVYLSGYLFNKGRQNVTVAYQAGYQISNEAQSIPAVSPYTVQSMAFWVASDCGVKYASNNAALVLTAGAPAAGQYSRSGSVYTFNVADAGKGVLISYGYVPIDVEQAAIELVGDYFKAKDRIGVQSKGIEGQTISFTNTMTERVAAILNQYRKVTPIQ